MKILINDANILIDLVKLDLLSVFFQFQGAEFKTTDFIFEGELYDGQKEDLTEFIQNGQLEILKSEEVDINRISRILNSTRGLSFEDCSAYYYAKRLNGILLTGDGKLRKQAKKKLEVRGVLYLFDEFLLQDLITFNLAVEKLNQLNSLNKRLPKKEIEKRLKFWQRREHSD